VAVIDLRTLNGLARLSTGSPVETGHTYYDASRDRDSQQTSRLTAQAVEKFQAAQVLVEQKLIGPAVEMLLASLLAAASDRAGRQNSVPPQEAGVWLYGEAMPKGLLSPPEADLITRAVSLSHCPSVPETLATELVRDTEAFLNSLNPESV
ncbi:MAG: helicase, partial [Desulfurivibrionaceae bacterium]